MNRDVFLSYVENDRGCEEDRLDRAVSAGLRKARNGRLDARKPFLLFAAGIFTAALCITVNLTPFKTAAEMYHRAWHKTQPGGAEALSGYVKDIEDNFRKYFGG